MKANFDKCEQSLKDKESKVDLLDLERQELTSQLSAAQEKLNEYDVLLSPIYERVKLHLSEFIKRLEDCA
jgi:chromosome segregation ATPase